MLLVLLLLFVTLILAVVKQRHKHSILGRVCEPGRHPREKLGPEREAEGGAVTPGGQSGITSEERW